MNIYDDNRLTRWGQRRLHGAFEECGGSRTWTVPTIAGEIAPAVTPYDWDRGRRSIEAAIQAGDNVLGHRVQLWWHHQWTDANSQYAVRVLTPTEREIAENIVIAMESMRPMGFLNVAGELRDHPVTRTRRGERTHPRRNENQPPELAIADPGASRSLRPPRLQAPSRTAAREAGERRRPASANELADAEGRNPPARGGFRGFHNACGSLRVLGRLLAICEHEHVGADRDQSRPSIRS